MVSQAAAKVPLLFFQALQQQDALKIWGYLSQRSQSVIVRLLAQNLPHDTIHSLEKAFSEGREPALTYWKQFTKQLNPESWMVQNYQAMAESDGEILVKCLPSQVYLRVIREGEAWKFGYIETFMDSR